MFKEIKSPDLNAPRFRPKRLNLLNKELYEKFVQQDPENSKISYEQFKSIINSFNKKIWEKVIANRDGVELPEQLGYLFIGTCNRSKKYNTNYKKSAELGSRVQYQNWESDNYLAKIFYTNYETKYKFKNHSLWGFNALRDFTRKVGETYPIEWKKYVVVDSMVKVSRLFRKLSYKQNRIKEVKELLKDYDEFNFT